MVEGGAGVGAEEGFEEGVGRVARPPTPGGALLGGLGGGAELNDGVGLDGCVESYDGDELAVCIGALSRFVLGLANEVGPPMLLFGQRITQQTYIKKQNK